MQAPKVRGCSRGGNMLGRLMRVLTIASAATFLLFGATALAAGSFDPSKADVLARAALPGPGDLPGGDWQITKQDDFSHDTPPDTSACKNSQLKIDQLGNQVDGGRAGR